MVRSTTEPCLGHCFGNVGSLRFLHSHRACQTPRMLRTEDCSSGPHPRCFCPHHRCALMHQISHSRRICHKEEKHIVQLLVSEKPLILSTSSIRSCPSRRA